MNPGSRSARDHRARAPQFGMDVGSRDGRFTLKADKGCVSRMTRCCREHVQHRVALKAMPTKLTSARAPGVLPGSCRLTAARARA